MAYTKDGQFVSGSNLEGSRVRRMIIQIQFADFTVVQTKNELDRIYREFIKGAFKDLCVNFYGIVHQADLDHCNNNHIHLLIELNRSVRLLTMLNNFRDAFGYNVGAISIDRCVLMYGTLRYFLHMEGNVENKHQYRISEIVTNVSEILLATYVDSEDDEMTYERLERICYDCDFVWRKIAKKLGLSAYKTYRYIIKDILDNEYTIRDNIDKEIPDICEVPF